MINAVGVLLLPLAAAMEPALAQRPLPTLAVALALLQNLKATTMRSTFQTPQRGGGEQHHLANYGLVPDTSRPAIISSRMSSCTAIMPVAHFNTEARDDDRVMSGHVRMQKYSDVVRTT